MDQAIDAKTLVLVTKALLSGEFPDKVAKRFKLGFTTTQALNMRLMADQRNEMLTLLREIRELLTSIAGANEHA